YREAAGDAARFVPPGDPAGLAEALREVLAGPASAARLVRAGKDRAAELDWRVLAPEVLVRYGRAGGPGPPGWPAFPGPGVPGSTLLGPPPGPVGGVLRPGE